jgi:hypothetical protein
MLPSSVEVRGRIVGKGTRIDEAEDVPQVISVSPREGRRAAVDTMCSLTGQGDIGPGLVNLKLDTPSRVSGFGSDGSGRGPQAR